MITDSERPLHEDGFCIGLSYLLPLQFIFPKCLLIVSLIMRILDSISDYANS
jgi:hypothetical protein